MEKWLEERQKMFEMFQQMNEDGMKMFEDNMKAFEEYSESFRESVKESWEEMPKFPMMPPMPIFPMMSSEEMPFMKAFKNTDNKNVANLMGIPKDVLQKLLKIDASPKDLEKLQKLLDFVFDMYEKKF
ncbi:MAG: hypothetical protein KBS56_03420 [Clostridiales bacterium]|nr:hypothetical protein [Candidatus Crickella equi]